LVKPCPAPQFLQAVADGLRGAAVTAAAPAPEAGFDTEHLRLLTDKLSEKADALRAANGRLAALTNLNLQMASERDPEELLAGVCAGARELLGARFAVLAIVGKEKGARNAVYVNGLATQSPEGVTDPRKDTGVLGKVYSQGSSIRLVNADETPCGSRFAGWIPTRARGAGGSHLLPHAHLWVALPG
jgi:hypothetical protein